MAITDRKLKVGTVLKARYKGETFTCEVKEGDGKDGLVYAISGKGLRKQTHPTIGKATAAVTAPAICANRWHFWTREADFAAGNGHKAPAEAAKKAGAKAEKKAPKKEEAARRSKNPRAKVERFACGDCGMPYPTQTRAIACSERHAAEASAEANAAQVPESQVPVGES